MCQYLFAAFSLKQRTDEGLTPEELEVVTRWRQTMAHVATEEMLHLALVQNVLSAIGAAPHLTRPNLPAPARHYPAGVNLTLVPFPAWALLEERVRDASTFCDAVIKSSPEDVASALGPPKRALTAVADSLARHFSDWGAESRFVTSGGEAAAIAMADEPIHFDEDVKPLFRERDRDSMRFAFDLWSLDDVATHADAILDRLEAGTMPCDGAWPTERVAVFRRWIDAGKPA